MRFIAVHVPCVHESTRRARQGLSLELALMIVRHTGVAHTFFSGETDKARAGELINVLREAKQPVPPELLAFGTTVKKKESKVRHTTWKPRR